jgi:hypothetical protein
VGALRHCAMEARVEGDEMGWEIAVAHALLVTESI